MLSAVYLLPGSLQPGRLAGKCQKHPLGALFASEGAKLLQGIGQGKGRKVGRSGEYATLLWQINDAEKLRCCCGLFRLLWGSWLHVVAKLIAAVLVATWCAVQL